MKLLHVHDFFAPGNSRFGFDMDRLLAARGHEVHVLSAVGERGPEDGAVLESVRFHTYPHRTDGGARQRFARARHATRVRFEALQKEHGFDALLLNQPLCANAVLDVPASRDPARVYLFISPWAAEWKASHPEAGRLGRWFHAGMRNRMERRAVDRADRVVVESEYIRSQLFEHHPSIGPDRVALVPGAVDLDRFCTGGTKAENRERFGIGEGKVLLTVRRLVRRMGVDLLLEAAATLDDVEVVVGGEGPLRAELEETARRLGVKARFLGHVPDEDLPALYRAADLFVLPTRELEGFGLVAIEAMACGTPAMGTPVGAIPEVLGAVDMLFREATAPAIAEGIRRYFGKDADAVSWKCWEHVSSHHDWKKEIVRVEDLLRKVVDEGRRHGRE